MGLLPRRLDVSPDPDAPRLHAVDDDGAEEAFDALGSETARRLLSAVYEEPRTPPELRDDVGTSLQNVHYHIGRLEDAGLVEPAGVGYSEKGTEMTVYAPASEAVVLFAAGEADRSRLEGLLARVFGLAAAVSLATVLFAVALQWWEDRRTREPSGATGPGAMVEDDAAPVSYDAASRTAAEVAGLDPVLAFFLGGCAVVLALVLWWLVRPRLRARLSPRSR